MSTPSGLTPGPGDTPWDDAVDPPPDETIVRIPVAGPAPFNTLAVFNHTVFNTFEQKNSAGAGFALPQLTRLRINGYSHNTPEQQQYQYSCTASLWGQALGDDNASFELAVDTVGAPYLSGTSTTERDGVSVDALGNFSIMVFIRAAVNSGHVVTGRHTLRCWVLFYESEPPAPLTPDQIETQTQALNAALQVQQLQAALSDPNTDLWQLCQALTPLEKQLSAGGYPEQELQALSLAVDALDRYTPAATEQAAFLLARAEARHNVIFRLTDSDRVEEAIPLIAPTLAVYRQYASLPNPRVFTLDSDLTQLDKRLDLIRQTQAALQAEQIDVDTLRQYIPTVDENAEYQAIFAEARQNLILRLLATDQPDPATALMTETLDGYRQYASTSTADRDRLHADLTNFVNGLDAAGRADLARPVTALISKLGVS